MDFQTKVKVIAGMLEMGEKKQQTKLNQKTNWL